MTYKIEVEYSTQMKKFFATATCTCDTCERKVLPMQLMDSGATYMEAIEGLQAILPSLEDKPYH